MLSSACQKTILSTSELMQNRIETQENLELVQNQTSDSEAGEQIARSSSAGNRTTILQHRLWRKIAGCVVIPTVSACVVFVGLHARSQFEAHDAKRIISESSKYLDVHVKQFAHPKYLKLPPLPAQVVQFPVNASPLLHPNGIGPQIGIGNPGKLHTEMQLRDAQCALDVTQVPGYLARAGLAINAATRTCIPALQGNEYVAATCTADIAAIIASFGWVATYITLSASRCSYTAKLGEICGGAITGLTSALATVAGKAAIVADNCAPRHAPLGFKDDAIWQLSRRLTEHVDESAKEVINSGIANISAQDPKTFMRQLRSAALALNKTAKFMNRSLLDGIPPSSKERDSEIATCVVDVYQAAVYLAQGSRAIGASVEGCPLKDFAKRAPSWKLHNLDSITEAICAADIGQILYGYLNFGAFIASAVTHCALATNVGALCASGLVGLVASLSGVIYLGSGIYLACDALPDLPHNLGAPLSKFAAQGITRRLKGEEEQVFSTS